MRRASSLEKTLMLIKIEGKRRKGWQDEMVGWHHWLNGFEFEQTPRVGDGQRGLACCSPWGCKESERLNWTEFIGRTDAKAEAPVLQPSDAKNRLIGKDPDAGKDWGQEGKRVKKDEMAGLHYWFNGHEFEQTLEDREGQGSLACCSPWGHNESDTTEWPNNNNKKIMS